MKASAGSAPAGADPIALDVHAHLIPLADAAVTGAQGVVAADDRLVVDGRTIGLSNLFHPEALIAWMDAQAVAQAWVSIPPPAYRQQLSPAAARAWFEGLGRGLAQACADHPGRLLPLHHLPLEHPALALEIAQRAIRAGEARFSVAAGGHGQVVFSDALLAPLWGLLGEADSFVFIHPGHCCDGRLDAFYLHNLLGNPYETAVAVSHLVLGGVVDRHPGIRFCLAHGGGAVPMLAGRLQRGFDTRRPGLDASLTPPGSSLARFMADSIVHDEAALGLAARVFGAQHLVFGSDWPFPMGLPRPHEMLAQIPPTLRRVIFQEAARALLERT